MTIPTSVDAQEDLTHAKYPGLIPLPRYSPGRYRGQLLLHHQQTSKQNRLTSFLYPPASPEMIFKTEDFLEATLNPLNRKIWGRSLAICVSNNHGGSLF